MSGPRRIAGNDAVDVTIRLTLEEHAMLKTLAARSSYGAEQGYVRAMIRDAWMNQQVTLLRRKRP